VAINVRPPLSVSVVAPNGGETLFADAPYLIRWAASGGIPAPGAFDVAVSIDGASYEPIPGCTGLDGAARSCVWDAPISATASIRVTARDNAGHVALAMSDATFAITASDPSLRVTSPNTPVSWAIGTQREITWTHNLGTHSFVHLQLSRDDGASWETIAAPVENATATTARSRGR
jgi:hypothetical protein